jgi:mono/diheme cytochrome c family protein
MNAMRFLILIVAAACAIAAGDSLVARAPSSAAEKRNPFEGNEHAQRAGAKLYAHQCASCHGNNREGGKNAPPLIQPEVQKAPSGTLFWVLRNGSLHRGMPSFAHLPEAQRWQIVTYLQSAAIRH